MSPANNKVLIFDTTMRDGELTPGVKMNLQQKISISQLLENMGIDIIEVGYPGTYQKDFEEVFQVSQIIKKSIICGLASANKDEINTLGEAIKLAKCAINGLGARKGNADLEDVVMGVLQQGNYQVDIDTTLMSKASELVAQITRIV